MAIISIAEAIAEIKNGKMVILVDDEDRENEGDLTIAAENVTPEIINFMATHGRGLICLPMTSEKCDQLGLTMMVENNTSPFETGFTVSIEARHGITTGISAADRATTIQTAVAPDAKPDDLVRPGHIFPLRSKNGGVIVRAGQTEGSVDLARLAGLTPAAVICEIMKEDGTMARMDSLETFSEEHDIGICTIADLIKYRMQTESIVRRAVEATVPTGDFGKFRVIVFENDMEDLQHIAIVKGEIKADKPVLVRVHSECLTGDIFGSLRCDCGDRFREALRMIADEGCGVLLYVRQEGRGIGLINKLKAYNLMDQGQDTQDADGKLGFEPNVRNYGIGAQALVNLGVRKIRLMTNNPKKMVGLQGYGLHIVEQVRIDVESNQYNQGYIQCKKLKVGHLLNLGATP